MSIVAARKQLQKEFAVLSRQALRIQAALQALDGASVNGTTTELPRKKYKMSAATRRKISLGRRKQLAATKK